jgi:hypothetical protein
MARNWSKAQRAAQSKKLKAAWAKRKEKARPWWRRLLNI